MGFATSDILTNDGLISEFICPICTQLVANPVVTQCTHVFCRSCYGEWCATQEQQQQQEYHTSASYRCPKCNTGMASHPAELKTANPLCWRLLCRVQVRCPLHAQGCSWVGDYGESSSHLVNSDSHRASQGSGASEKASAEALKQEGNSQFEIGAFREAIKLYSKAISLQPTIGSYFGNRAAAWLRVGATDECIADCRRCLELAPDHTKSHLRLCKALCEKGLIGEAAEHIARVAADLVDDAEVQHECARQQDLKAAHEEGIKAFNAGHFEQALACFEAVRGETGARCFDLMIAKILVRMGKCDRAISSTLQLLKANDRHADAYAVRGEALFHNNDLDQAVKHLRECLRLDPDHPDAQRSIKKARTVADCFARAQDCVSKRLFTEAVAIFTEAIDACRGHVPLQAALMTQLHADRANCYLRLGEYQMCLQDCDQAIAGRDDCKEAWITRAAALISTSREQQALDEMTKLQTMYEHDTLVRHWKDKADFELRKKARPDYYEILMVSKIATEGEIKNAYKARALEWHPDRHAGGETGVTKEEAESRFKLIGEALEILGDTHKRKLYDDGHDKEGIEEKQREQQRGHGHHHGHGRGHGY